MKREREERRKKRRMRGKEKGAKICFLLKIYKNHYQLLIYNNLIAILENFHYTELTFKGKTKN